MKLLTAEQINVWRSLGIELQILCDMAEATALLREFYSQVNAIHGDEACDKRTLERVRSFLSAWPH